LNVYTSAFNLNFFFGMGAYWAWQKGLPGGPAIATGLTILLAATVWVTHPGLSSLLCALAFALLIAGFVALEERGLVRVPAILALIGDASYSIYLTHEHVASLGIKILLRLHMERLLGREGIYLLVIVATATAGTMLYLILEKPLVRRLRQWEPRRRNAAGPALQVRPKEKA
jgi:peptidoglycan/LPS O-acetylase OafA/YrhL